MDNITNALVGALTSWGIHPQVVTFLVSLIPLLELRGSILVAGVALQCNLVVTYIVAVIGNMLPIPFILLFIKKIFDWMKTRPKLGKFPVWMENKAMKKSSQIEKYGYLGLMLFVAVPLPGTGAWTGALLATMFKLKPLKSLLFILLGVAIAGIIMTIIAATLQGIL